MKNYLVYPRLPDFVARSIHADLAGKSISELRDLSETSHPMANLASGSVVSDRQLAHTREGFRSEFDEHMNARASGFGDDDFDRRVGAFLHTALDMSPYEAGDRRVWSFLSMVLLPEVGPWRFPKLTLDRFVGPPIRNVLGRTWWRAHLLGPDLGCSEYDSDPLGEDELYTLIEKTTIGFNMSLVPRLAAAIYRNQPERTNRNLMVREFTKDILRIVPWCDLSALEPSALDAFLDSRIMRISGPESLTGAN